MSKLAASKSKLSAPSGHPKKKLPEPSLVKRLLIEAEHPELSIRQQCELLGLNRSSYYYQPATETPLNLTLMRLIDEQYTARPIYGRRKMTIYLREQGYDVNPKRVRRLMQQMGLEAIYPKPPTTVVDRAHRLYPYLLRGVAITRPNQVWSTDTTYIPMQNGFMYLTAVIDWFSRYVLAWEISNTLDTDFCLVVLERALQQGTPTIFNTDRAPGGAFNFSGGDPPFPVGYFCITPRKGIFQGLYRRGGALLLSIIQRQCHDPNLRHSFKH